MSEAAEKIFFNPASIPLASWNIIFNHVAVNDLKNLSLVNRSFYKMIGELSDTTNRIWLSIRGSMSPKILNIMLKSSRIYKNIEIRKYDGAVDKLLEKIGSDVKQLRINEGCVLTKIEMIKLFKQVHSNLEFFDLQFWCDNRSEETLEHETFKLAKLKTLQMEYFHFVFLEDLLDFLPDSIVTLIFRSSLFINHSVFQKFAQFLVNQKCLKHLKLMINYRSNRDKNYFQNEDLKHIQLKLEKLEIMMSRSQRWMGTYLIFLESQAESLKELKLINIPLNDCINVFENMPCLERLEIKFYGLRQFSSSTRFFCPAIKTLVCSFSDSDDTENELESLSPGVSFIKKFSGVSEVVINMSCTTELLQMMADSFCNLKKIVCVQFLDNDFEDVKFDGVQELVVGNRRTRRFNMELAFTAFPNLKSLIILKNLSVSAAECFYLLKNFTKLEHLGDSKWFKNQIFVFALGTSAVWKFEMFENLATSSDWY